MSKLDDLLQGVKVEWTKLGNNEFIEIANSGRKPVKASLRSNGDIPYYGANNIQDYVNGFTHNGEYVLIAEDGSSSLENYSIQYATGKFWANNHVHVLRGKNKISTKFLYYYLQIIDFKPFLTGGGRAKLTKGRMLEIQVPIPPIEIQQEIVRILDQLTDTTNNLKNELENERQIRKKQFEFYREQLLSFEKNDIEWKEIKDIFNLKNGYTPSKSKQEYWEDGTIPWFRMEDIRKNGRVLKEAIQKINISAIKGGKLFPANSLIVATSATIGEHALVKVPYLSNQRFTNLSLKEEYTLKYNVEFLNYYCFILDEWCKNNTTIGNFAGVDMTKFKKFMFPIPSLEEQERIVKLLDQFDAAHTAIEEEITKEIKLRTQQYEYYREKLLTFPKN